LKALSECAGLGLDIGQGVEYIYDVVKANATVKKFELFDLWQ